MSDEPKDPDSDLLAPIVAIIACIAAGAKMPRKIQPGEDLIADASRELGFKDEEWACAPGGRLWFARAFRQLGDALAAPPKEVQGEKAEEVGQAAAGSVGRTDPDPQDPAGGAGLNSAPTRQSRRRDPSAHRSARARKDVPRREGV